MSSEAKRRKVQVCQILAEDLKAAGVDSVFGLMSDDTAVFATALDSSGLRFYGARHENDAVAMAEGYAYASGRLGVALIGRGPATANGLHAAVYASRTGSPVLIMYGDATPPGGPANGIGPDYKGFNAQGVLSAAGLRNFHASSPAAARAALADAVAAAQRGTAVALLLPTVVQLAEIAVREDEEALIAPPPPTRPGAPRPQAIRAAAALLRESRRPLIVAGRGAHLAGARESIERLAERIGALLVTTARGKDMFRGNPFALGIVGSFSHALGRRYIEQADCVLVFGAGLNFLTTSFGEALPSVPLIQVDATRAHIGRWHHADVGVVGDARLAAEALCEALPEAAERPFRSEEVRRALAAFDPAQEFEAANTPRTLDPRTLAIELDKLLPQRRRLVYDAGNFMIAAPYLSVPDPGCLKLTSEFASIGLGFGTALGVAKARPEDTTVLVIGDGGFVMTMGELETAVREDLPLVIVLMNDCAYGAELHFLKARQLPVTKSMFPDVDFAPVAEAFGFQAATIRTLDDLRQAAPLLTKPEGPVLLDCKINAAVAAPFIGEFASFEARQHGG